MTLSLQIYDGPDRDNMLADFTSRLADEGFSFSSNEHGFAGLRVPLVPMDPQESFSVYDWPGTPHVVVSDEAAGVAWEGRLEDIAIVTGGVRLAALGYWRSLTDVPYTALWSTTGSGDWRAVTADDTLYHTPSKYNMDNNNRVYIALKKNQVYQPGTERGRMSYFLPYNGERDLFEISYTYDVTLPTGWAFRILSHSEGFGNEEVDRIISGNGASQTGSATISLGASPGDIVSAEIRKATAGSYTNTNEDDTWYIKLTNIRIVTKDPNVLASDIATALATYVNGVNADQLSSSDALIEATTTDLQDELYEDALPADILDRLAKRHNYEAGVWEDRRLHFRARDTQNRHWHVDVTSIVNLERSLEEIRNSAYGIYRDGGTRTLRTAVADNAASQDRYGLVRRGSVKVQTSSQTEAETHRDAFLSDRADFAVRADIEFDKVFDENGSEHPLYAMRAGDKVTMRNLPPGLSADVDNLRTFLIGRTEFQVSGEAQGEIKLEPRTPTPTLVTLVARREGNE